MANLTVKQVLDAVYSSLSNNVTLKAEIKQFLRGAVDPAQVIFPALALGNMDIDIEPVTHGGKGKDKHTYTFEIAVAVNNIAGGGDTAFYGLSPNKGIIDLVEDVLVAIRVNDFSGTFIAPVNVQSVRIRPAAGDRSGFLWIASILFTGELMHARNG